MVSPSKAARLLDVHPNTVNSWAHRALEGDTTKLCHVERNPRTGYLLVDLAEVKRLAKITR